MRSASLHLSVVSSTMVQTADAGEAQLAMYNMTAMVARVEQSSLFMMTSIVSRLTLYLGWKVKGYSDDLIAISFLPMFSSNIFILGRCSSYRRPYIENARNNSQDVQR